MAADGFVSGNLGNVAARGDSPPRPLTNLPGYARAGKAVVWTGRGRGKDKTGWGGEEWGREAAGGVDLAVIHRILFYSKPTCCILFSDLH